MGSAAAAALLVAAAGALVLLPRARLRPARPARAASRPASLRRALVIGLGVSATAVLFGLPIAVTLIGGPAAAIVAARVRGRRHGPTEAELREMAGFLDLFAACLDGGCATDAAMAACLDAGLLRGGPADAFGQTRALLSLGSDAPTAWQPLARYPPLAPLANSATRSAMGGVRLADAARETAAELRARQRAAADRRAARAGVAMTAPLALCFLPAFVCLGLAPTIIGLISSLHLW